MAESSEKLYRRRNLWLLGLAQMLFQVTSITMVSVSGLVGAMLAPDPKLATVPFGLITVSVALLTVPVSLFMKRHSRRAGFLIGAVCGALSALLALLAVLEGSFLLICLAAPFQGVYQATMLYYRYAAAEDVPAQRAGTAISAVLSGGLVAAVIAPTLSAGANRTIELAPYAGPFFVILAFSLLALLPLSALKLRGHAADAVAGASRPLARILGSARGIAALASNMAAWSLMVLLMSGVPLAMKSAGYDYDVSVHVIQWHVFAMYIPSFFSGRLIDRFGVLPVQLAGLAAMGGAVLGTYVGETFPVFAGSLVLVGLGWNFLYVSGTTLLTRIHTASEAAKTQGAAEFLSFAASALGALSSGALIATLGWQALGLIGGAVVALTALAVAGYGLSLLRPAGAEA